MMLVLSRKIGERILIGENVAIQVLEVKGNRIRLGIEAPTTVRVLREELAFSAELPPAASQESAPRHHVETRSER